MSSFKNFSINKRNKNWLKILIGGVILLFLLVILNFFASAIKNSFYALSSPMQKNFWSAGGSSSNFLGSFLNAGSLAKENENLKNENQKLLSQVVSLQSIEQGNQALSDVSASCQNNGYKVVMAGVIGLDDNDIVSINKGSADGISEGMPVISQQNILFGKVFKVYKNFSKIMLISNKNSVVNVKVQQNNIESAIDTGNATGTANINNTNSEVDGVIKGSGG